MTLKGSELYTAGQLTEAIDAMSEEVKGNPTDQTRRGFLAELLCVAGDLERADKQLDVLSKQDPQAAVGFGLLRQLVRAEQARQQFYSEGRVPEFIVPPDEHLRSYLEASILLRDNQPGQAAERLHARRRCELLPAESRVNFWPSDSVYTFVAIWHSWVRLCSNRMISMRSTRIRSSALTPRSLMISSLI